GVELHSTGAFALPPGQFGRRRKLFALIVPLRPRHGTRLIRICLQAKPTTAAIAGRLLLPSSAWVSFRLRRLTTLAGSGACVPETSRRRQLSKSALPLPGGAT